MNLTTKFYRVAEVAEMFGVSRQAVLGWIEKGILTATKPDRVYFIDSDEIERMKRGEPPCNMTD